MAKGNRKTNRQETPELSLLNGQHWLLADLTRAAKDKESHHLSSLYPLLDSMTESTTTLRRLATPARVRDGYVIARVVYESSVNACFILTDPENLATRAWRHARQKALRDLDRTIDVAGAEAIRLRWSGADHLLADPDNQVLLREYTSKSGREITAWTPESVRQRISRIHKKFGREQTLGMMYGLLLYRHASEIAHGTLYGALFSWGAMNPDGPPKSPSEMRAFRIEQARLIMMLVGFTLESVNRIIAPELGVPEIAEKAIELRLAYSHRPRAE